MHFNKEFSMGDNDSALGREQRGRFIDDGDNLTFAPGSEL